MARNFSCYKDYPEIIDLHIAICESENLEYIKEAEDIMEKYRSTIGMTFNYKPVSEMVVEELNDIFNKIRIEHMKKYRLIREDEFYGNV
ncbi:MAG: hypothetical protein IJ193_00905 [Bacilli bacterium]|nr:hypothetical protein [Bacilli bacterium]